MASLVLRRSLRFLKVTIPVCNKLVVSKSTDNSKSADNSKIMPYSFENIHNKNKDTFLDMIRIYVNREKVHRRGHVEFIYAALKQMKEFNVHQDLETYRALINVMPKGKFVATNMFQIEFMHYPKQQQCIIDVLDSMEHNGVMPDQELGDLLMNIFGIGGFPLRKYWRMMYWMPKFRNLSPWPIPRPLPRDLLEIAKIAIQRIMSVDVASKVKVYESKEIEESIDKTWIVSGQAPMQKRLLEEHDITEPIYVEGAFRIWLRTHAVNYFVLRTKAKAQTLVYEDLDDVSNFDWLKPSNIFSFRPPVRHHVTKVPSVHEQEDGTVLAVCASGTSSKDSLLSWIRHLEKDGNPALASSQIVFTLRSPSDREVTTTTNEKNEEKDVM